MKVYITWINLEGHVHNYTCPVVDSSFQCPPTLDIEPIDVFSGGLFIGTNFTATALALQNDGHLEKRLTRHLEFLLMQLGYGRDIGNIFPLFPNGHLFATLAVTHRQTLKNTDAAALGFRKVGCGAQKIFQHR